MALSEVDVSAYDTEPGDPKKRGVRLTIRGGVKSSLAFSVEASGAINPFSTGRLVMSAKHALSIFSTVSQSSKCLES